MLEYGPVLEQVLRMVKLNTAVAVGSGGGKVGRMPIAVVLWWRETMMSFLICEDAIAGRYQTKCALSIQGTDRKEFQLEAGSGTAHQTAGGMFKVSRTQVECRTARLCRFVGK